MRKACVVCLTAMLLQASEPAINKQEGTVQRQHSTESTTIKLSSMASVEPPAPFGKYIENINGVPLELARMPAGSFLMGNDKSPNPEEKPAHYVRLKPFYIGQYEITRKQWNAVVDTLPKVNRDLARQYIDPAWNFEEMMPADALFWDDVLEFCNRLTVLTGHMYRLPSESEWEYACRAGTQTEYSFGDEVNYNLAYFRNIAAGDPSFWLWPVGGKGYSNEWGLFDMHGNVAEWCLDVEHSDYSGAPTDGIAWFSGGNQNNRVIRGGQYSQNPKLGRSSSRRFWSRYVSVSGFGFRVVAEIAPTIGGNPIIPASAASYSTGRLAADSIVALFGSGLADEPQSASGNTLPLSLGGVSVFIRDHAGNEYATPIFFASPDQINIQIPSGVAMGPATIFGVKRGNIQSTGPLEISALSPGLFTADASGKGVAAGFVIRINANGDQKYEPIAMYDQTTGTFSALPIDVRDVSDQTYLILFGTGIRHRSGLGSVTATVGGEPAEVTYAGIQKEYRGLDQCNIRLPQSLTGRGTVSVKLTVDNIDANPVLLRIK